MEEIIIKEVLSKADLKKFVAFPFKLYENNPYWIPSIRSDELSTLEKTTNPAFRSCEARYWLAYKNGQIAGRIAGIINNEYIKKWKNKYARFGWIDFIDDIAVSTALVQKVEEWAKEKGMTAVHGPLGFTDFDPEGMLVDGFEKQGTMTTIYNYPYYPQHFEKLDYSKDVDWLEYEIKIPGRIPEKIQRISQLAEKKYELRSFKATRSKDLLIHAKGIFDLLNLAYKDLYGVVTLSEEQIDKYISQYFSFIQQEYVSVIIDKNEKVVAFAICIPSLSRALQRSKGRLFPFGIFHLYKALKKNDVVDLYLIAVHPNFQGKGVNAMLIKDLGEVFIKKNISKVITHPVLEKNNKVHTLWKNFETQFIKRRRCYIRQLNQ